MLSLETTNKLTYVYINASFVFLARTKLACVYQRPDFQKPFIPCRILIKSVENNGLMSVCLRCHVLQVVSSKTSISKSYTMKNQTDFKYL